jgi:hypothetical protein
LGLFLGVFCLLLSHNSGRNSCLYRKVPFFILRF